MNILSLLIPALIVLMVKAASIDVTFGKVQNNNTTQELMRRIDPAAKTDEILYQYSIEAFLTAKAQKNPPELDWESDGCTGAPNRVPLLYNFSPSCQRHDFGYANYRIQHRLCSGTRNSLDQQFKRDMNNNCSKRSPHWYQYFQRRACRIAAESYFRIVSQLYDPDYSPEC